MRENNRIENNELRKFLAKHIPELLNDNKLFLKIYGDNFASQKVLSNVLRVYSNETVGLEQVAGYCNSDKKEVTICSSGEEGQLLSQKDIEENKDLEETVLHEYIHAILAKSSRECKNYGLIGGTGILERYKNGELGRGLNEGFTEWMCEKTGFKPKAYPIHVDEVKLLEAAIGTERVMELGKGNIRERFPRIMDMTYDDIKELLRTYRYYLQCR